MKSNLGTCIKSKGHRAYFPQMVYKIKHHTYGSIDRHKPDLVARGFSQQYGLDYNETFNPVAKLTSVRVLLAVVATKNGTCGRWI